MPQPNDSSYGISNPAGGLWNYPTDPDGTNLPSTGKHSFQKKKVWLCFKKQVRCNINR